MNNVYKKSNENINQNKLKTLIFIASDHAGYNLKEEVVTFLKEQNYFVENFGCNSMDSVDYPDYAVSVAASVNKNLNSKGILLCGTGSGMAITANKVKGIRAVNCFTEEIAEMAIKHNNANVLCIGARILETKTAINIIKIFLNTDFEGGRHQTRIDKIHNLTKC